LRYLHVPFADIFQPFFLGLISFFSMVYWFQAHILWIPGLLKKKEKETLVWFILSPVPLPVAQEPLPIGRLTAPFFSQMNWFYVGFAFVRIGVSFR
jgi:hypothetical protein